MKPSDLLNRWMASRPNEATDKEATAVLEAMGCQVKVGGEGHLRAYHPGLVDHPRFRYGKITVNCHYRGKHGAVHPSAIEDIVKAALYLKNNSKGKE